MVCGCNDVGSSKEFMGVHKYVKSPVPPLDEDPVKVVDVPTVIGISVPAFPIGLGLTTTCTEASTVFCPSKQKQNKLLLPEENRKVL